MFFSLVLQDDRIPVCAQLLVMIVIAHQQKGGRCQIP